MSTRHVRLALVSDLHAYHPVPGRASASYLPANPQVSDPDPFRNLDELIKREQLSVDLVVCPGDICDKADFRGFQYAWQKLNALRLTLGATQLIATCGNHDLNSRHIAAEDDPDPKGALQTIEPQFPFDCDQLTNHFWARNFALLSPSPGVRVLVLNTSAYHGGAEGELDYGRVSKRTISAIEQRLSNAEKVDLNILLCHHHVRPLKGLWGTAPDGEFMKKGGELLSMLTNRTASPWLVLHGHRHAPNLEHITDPACIVVGASSFAGQMPGRFNQFHVLDIVVDHTQQQPLRGTIDTWSWNVTGGWQRRHINSDDEGFPPQCGFGSLFQPRAVAQQIEQLLGGGPDYKGWDEVISKVPDVQFMTPAHLRQVEQLLEQVKIELLRDREGKLTQVGRSA